MGGGKSPLNVFKISRGDDPKEVLNWRLWLAVFSFGIMGTARGKDPKTPIIQGVFIMIKKTISNLGCNVQVSTKA